MNIQFNTILVWWVATLYSNHKQSLVMQNLHWTYETWLDMLNWNHSLYSQLCCLHWKRRFVCKVGYTFLLCVGLCKSWKIYSCVIGLTKSLLLTHFCYGSNWKTIMPYDITNYIYLFINHGNQGFFLWNIQIHFYIIRKCWTLLFFLYIESG